MEIKVTLNASPDFLEALKLLASAFTGNASTTIPGAAIAPVKPEPEAQEPVKPEPEAQEPVRTRTRKPAAAKEEPKEEPDSEETKQEPAAETAKTLTFEDVRAEVSKKSAEGKREEIRQLLSKYGCQRVPELPEDRFEDFVKDLRAI